MRILTWNINGIRSVKKELGELLNSSKYDVICVQETKVTRDQLDEPSAIVDGYNSYFSFSRGRSGYSGVATFVKDTCAPIKAEESISGGLVPGDQDHIGCYGDQSRFSDEELQSLDHEGRTVITQHKMMDSSGEEQMLTIINVYCPRADPENEDRKVFKIRFYELLQIRAEAILKDGSHVMIVGDVNTSHKKLDHCDPADDKEFYSHPGRQWLNRFLWEADCNYDLAKVTQHSDHDTSLTVDSGGKFCDAFRKFHPNRQNAFTCWSTVTGSRATNYGTRIDYIFGDVELVQNAFSDCNIMPDVMGSDHCPVEATLDWEIMQSRKIPDFCTKFMPEFSGKQQKLSSFFKKSVGDKRKNEGVSVKSEDISELSNSQESKDSGIIADVSCGTERDQNSALKRSATGSLKPNQDAKRLKKDDKKQSLGKQGNLLAFFGKRSSKVESSKPTKNLHPNSDYQLTISAIPPEKIETKLCDSSTELTCKTNSEVDPAMQPNAGVALQRSASDSWKSLLKGPPPPPLCKGHQESCLLRTVKKDSLNKGRQFWVCPRPEGHKSNPEARCDYFVWVDKKKS